MKKQYIVTFFLLLTVKLFAQTDTVALKQIYYNAFSELDSMLSNKKPMNFKLAVFITENAYFENKLDYIKFCSVIQMYSNLSQSLVKSRQLQYNKEDKETIEKLAGVFTIMTDTISIEIDTNKIGKILPFTYDFEDFFGTNDWTKMFVTKLLQTHSGNCHSLPFLYKIICEDLGVNVYLAQAPNHFYIKYRSKRDGWYNTELTSGFFPIDAWLFASGYITLEAVRNGVYMDTLSLKQSISVCILDLARGYEHKFGAKGDSFVINCCDRALNYYPNSVNAILLKAETLKKQFENFMKQYNTTKPNEVLKYAEPKAIFTEMKQLYLKIYKLGYRSMPDEMYIKWLMSLRTETDKYINTKLNFNPINTNKK